MRLPLKQFKKRLPFGFTFGALSISIASVSTLAHQPVMDMAPRWNSGYGVQTRIEHTEAKTTTWLEGVYTFKPSVRVTLKLPYIDSDNTDRYASGTGNAILAVPLKRYHNNGAFTSNWGITPSVRMPTGSSNSEDNDWDTGLSLSYSSESRSVYQLYDFYTLDDKIGIDINYGFVFADGKGSSWFTLWDISAQESNDGERILTGPVLVYFKSNTIVRAEYKFAALDNDDVWKGDSISIGIGFVY